MTLSETDALPGRIPVRDPLKADRSMGPLGEPLRGGFSPFFPLGLN
jgi:hypothetical protein